MGLPLLRSSSSPKDLDLRLGRAELPAEEVRRCRGRAQERRHQVRGRGDPEAGLGHPVDQARLQRVQDLPPGVPAHDQRSGKDR